MKLCDRCYKSGDYKPGTREIKVTSTDETFDICETCFHEFENFLNNVTPKTKKKKGQ